MSPGPQRPPRVAVTRSVTRFPATVGVGKVWSRSLAALTDLGVPVEVVEPGTARALAFRPEVWLFEGHLGPIEVRRPTVALLQEAPWSDPDLAGMLTPEWVEQLGPPSRASARSARMVLTPSASSAAQITEDADIDPGRCRVVPYGVDPLVFHGRRRAAGRAIVDAAGAAGRPYVLAVATMHRRKNLVSLRRAMAAVADAGLPHVLVMVLSVSPDDGDRTDRDDRDQTDVPGHEGRTVLLRDLDELSLAAVMSSADAFCQPSLMEGFGLPALEAMACGTPVVVSDRGSLPEVVGEAGVLFEPTAEGIAAGLFTVLGQPDETARRARLGLERSRRFTWQATATGWLEVLQTAARPDRGGRPGPGPRRPGRSGESGAGRAGAAPWSDGRPARP